MQVDKDAKFTVSRENGESKTAIQNKPTGTLVSVYNDTEVFYIITKQTYPGQTFVDYFSARCLPLDAENLKCGPVESLYRDN